jgi:sensor histidine kinase YesM
MIKFVLIFSFLLSCFSQTTFNEYDTSDAELFSIQFWRLSTDTVEFDKKEWVSYRSNAEDKDITGKRFFKTTIKLSKNRTPYEQLGLWFMGSYSAYDIYWDGHLLGKNGIVSNKKAEQVSGTFSEIFRIPTYLSTTGMHELTLALSNFNSDKTLSLYSSYIGELATIHKIESRESFRVGFLSNLYFITAFLCLIFYKNGGKFKPYLTFSVFCFFSLLLSVKELLMYHYSINNVWIPFLKIASSVIIPVKYFSLYYFILDFLQFKKWGSVFLIIILVFILFTGTVLFYFILVNLIFIAFYAILLKKRNALYVLMGLLFYLVFSMFSHFYVIGHEYDFGIVTFLLVVFYLIGKSAKELQTEKDESLLKSERLENELLKKSIQPHFINNTLLSIIVWIKKQPEIAIEMIHALSEEFDLIIQFSKQTKISIEDEIELCKKHLFIMSQRREQEFTLEVSNSVGSFLIPPLVLHTLVENSISHLSPNQEKLCLVLNIKKDSNNYLIELISPSDKKVKTSVKEGVGYSYIKSRLTETYKNNWAFVHEQDELNWIEKIWISDEKNTHR